MAQFFINRPIFAWVIAAFIFLFGVMALRSLPIAQYPDVAPPSVNITVVYAGADAQTISDSVVSLIERELSSIKNLLYFESSADASGAATIVATFKSGTDPEMAQVDIQNKIKVVEPRLPQAVRQSGISVEAAESGFLMIVGLKSDGGSLDGIALSDYMARNITDELRRVEGVGRIVPFGAEQAMRVWVDPAKLLTFGMSMKEVITAISEQNVQSSPGNIGAAPQNSGQRVTVPLIVKGQLGTPDAFKQIVLRSNTSGAKVLLGDVARVDYGAQTYNYVIRENGQPSTAIAIQLAPGGNAVRTAAGVAHRLEELRQSMPAGMHYSIPFNTAPFVTISIEKVVYTLIEAMVLVFAVMYLFLQNVRYTLIPAIVAPIALLGTFAVMSFAGFSINVFTMFGMVLAIGIVVDDAIVVVENVERIMATEQLSPYDATCKAMKEITGAVVGITLALTAVFIPMALSSGSVGVIYRQFSLSMSVSILFSAFLALTLTPALCATLLQPLVHGHAEKKGFFGWFNRKFDRLSAAYEARLVGLALRVARVMFVFAALCLVLFAAFKKLPSAFLPVQDQGYFITSIQLPADATMERTLVAVKAYERHIASRTAVASNMAIVGYGFSGSGSNAALMFTVLKDWGARDGSSSRIESELAQKAMQQTTEGQFMSLLPPAIPSLGTSSGFALRLEDRGNQGYAKLKAAEATLIALASKSPLLAGVYADGLPSGTSVRLDIDRIKALSMGVPFATISETLSAAFGSAYINDFPNAGRMQQVIVQADSPSRMQIDDVLKFYVRNDQGQMVPLSAFVQPVWTHAPLQLVRYQGYPAVRLSGAPAAAVSSGVAMQEMERLAQQLPHGFSVEWTGQSLQEQASSSQAPVLMALSLLVVFLVLAALYESWSIPVAVLLVVPLGLLGAVGAVLLRDMPNDVFFRVGMITVIGLSAKNAILIVEFAKQLREEGRSAVDAAVTAARMRLRPIIMTSLAFGIGVVPLMVSTGASSETQHAIGTGVFGGILAATVLAIFFVPVFFVLVMSVQERLIDRFKVGRPTSTNRDRE